MGEANTQKNVRMDAAARREQILNTACGLFYKYGYDSVTTKQLAEALGCSEGLIFKYFPSKDAIYQALMQEWAESMTEPVVFERIDDSPLRMAEKPQNAAASGSGHPDAHQYEQRAFPDPRRKPRCRLLQHHAACPGRTG